MDELSRVEFKKKANNMELTLTDGHLPLDVQKKLDNEEKLEAPGIPILPSHRQTAVSPAPETQTPLLKQEATQTPLHPQIQAWLLRRPTATDERGVIP